MPETPLARSLRLVGADASLECAVATDALGAAIKYGSGSDLATIADGYKARREQQIHDLLVGADPESQ